MARTNFSGPINEGSVQQTLNKTGASNSYVWDVNAVTGRNRNVGFVKASQSFYFDHSSVTLVSAGAATIAAAADDAGERRQCLFRGPGQPELRLQSFPGFRVRGWRWPPCSSCRVEAMTPGAVRLALWNHRLRPRP